MRRACSIILFIFIFLPLFWLAVLLTNIQFSALNPEFIKTTLSKNNTYEKFLAAAPQMAQEKVEQEAEETGGEKKDESVSSEMYQQIVQDLDPKWLQSQSETIISSLFKYLNSNEKNPNIELDLTEAKPVIVKELTASFEERYNTLPSCTEKEFKQNIEVKKEIKCKVPGLNFTEILNKYDTENIFETEIGKKIPDKINLADYQENLTPEIQSYLDGLSTARGIYKSAKLGVVLIFVLALLVLLACAGIWKGKTYSFWAILGAFLGIAGIATLLDGLNLYLSSFYFQGSLENIIVAQAPKVDLSIITIFQPLVVDLLRKMGTTELLLGLVLTIIGFLAVYLLPKKRNVSKLEIK